MNVIIKITLKTQVKRHNKITKKSEQRVKVTFVASGLDPGIYDYRFTLNGFSTAKMNHYTCIASMGNSSRKKSFLCNSFVKRSLIRCFFSDKKATRSILLK